MKKEEIGFPFFMYAKKGTQTVRYEISDMFLRFWFRYFEGNRTLVEMNQFEVVEWSKVIDSE